MRRIPLGPALLVLGAILFTSIVLIALKVREDRKMDRWADRQRPYIECMATARIESEMMDCNVRYPD